MPSAFHGINLSSTALRAFQRGLDVTGHNIANVNTPGYSRQTISFSQSDPTTFYGLRPLTLGSGVNVSAVSRVRDLFLQNRRIGEQSEFGRFSSLAQNLGRIESLMPMGPGGITDSMDRFFNSWSALSANPNEPGVRQEVQLAGQTLALRVRSTYGDLLQFASQTEAGVTQTVQDINRLGEQIANLNAEIRSKQAMGEQPNDLLDLRDQALMDLSELVDVDAFQLADGSMGVYINQFSLVDSSGSRTFPGTFDPVAQTVSDANGTYSVTGGRLAGQFQSLVATRDAMAQLDLLANTLRTEINGLHSTGTTANGTTGVAFFNDSAPQSGAIDFDLSALVKGDPNNIAAGVSGAAGDGGLALTLSRLREGGIAGLGGKTFNRFYADLLGSVGRDTAYFRSARDTQIAVLEQIDTQIQSISGVSLDDEMANMLRFQRSYQAVAKALSVFDQVTEDLIGMLRR